MSFPHVVTPVIYFALFNDVIPRGWVCASGPRALIRRNLDQAPVRIPAIDRTQRAAGTLFGDRAFLDRHAVGFEMRDHLIRRARGQETQIVAASGLVIGGEP